MSVSRNIALSHPDDEWPKYYIRHFHRDDLKSKGMNSIEKVSWISEKVSYVSISRPLYVSSHKNVSTVFLIPLLLSAPILYEITTYRVVLSLFPLKKRNGNKRHQDEF